MINRVILTGRLVADPELKYTTTGLANCRFRLAVNRAFSNQQGDRQSDFISIAVWRKQAENVANFLKKGSLVALEGRIQTGSYDGQDGKRVYTTEVVADSVQFLESKSANSGQQQSGGTNGYQQKQNSSQGNYGANNANKTIDDSDLPF